MIDHTLRDWRHDIGEPLLAIRLYAQTLQAEPQMPPSMRQALLETIENQAILLQQRLEDNFGEFLSNSDC